jgi:hypothetical protein
MRVEKNDPIAGLPAKTVRDFLRRLRDDAWSAEPIAEYFNLSATEVTRVIQALVTLQILEQTEDSSPEGEKPFYFCGQAGRGLRNANFRPRISRAKADRLVAGFLERVAEVNAEEDRVYTVTEVRVFGSYAFVGDVDLAIELRPHRADDRHDWVERVNARADRSGKQLRSPLQRLFYGETEIIQRLKARSPYLEFHRIQELEQLGSPSRVLFKRKQ